MTLRRQPPQSGGLSCRKIASTFFNFARARFFYNLVIHPQNFL